MTPTSEIMTSNESTTTNGTLAATTAAKPKKVNHAHVQWAGEKRFDGGRTGGPVHRIDAGGTTGPGPVDALLHALAACSSVDLLEILGKRRTPVESLTVDVTGDRADATPARLTRIGLHFTIVGAGIERVHAERAAELAVTKYCSVRDSLDPAIPIEITVTVNGA